MITATTVMPCRPTMPQYTKRQVLAIWALAAGLMAAVAWWWVPLCLPSEADSVDWAKALLVGMSAGLVAQGALVLLLVRLERGDLQWATLKDALMLHRPRDPRSGRRGGRVWWVCVPLAALMGLEFLIPAPTAPVHRDLAQFAQSAAGADFFRGNWCWFALVGVMCVFNTMAGEELLFRGWLLPRMRDAFGRFDWLVNGVLFALYHLHQPWSIPAALPDAFFLAWPSKYFSSTWIGIAVHSTQSVFLMGAMLWLVLA